MKLFEDIGWKFFMWKISRDLNAMESKTRRLRKKHCRKGIHKIISASVSVKEPKKRMVTIRYLKCQFCQYMFFAKHSDKRAYIAVDQRSVSALQEFFSSIKPKHSSDVGENLSGDVSVRAETK